MGDPVLAVGGQYLHRFADADEQPRPSGPPVGEAFGVNSHAGSRHRRGPERGFHD